MNYKKMTFRASMLGLIVMLFAGFQKGSMLFKKR